MTTGDYPDSPISKKRLLNDLNNLIHAWSANKFRGSATIPLNVLVGFRKEIRDGHYDFEEAEEISIARNVVMSAILKGNQRLRETFSNLLGKTEGKNDAENYK